jgi:tellurite resistance protein
MSDKPYLQFFENIEQLDIFVRGLYHVAAVDGVAEEELQVIQKFLDAMGEPDLMDSLQQVPFDPRMAALTLTTHHQRALFIKTILVLVRADGVITDEERAVLEHITDVFEMNDQLAEFEQETADATL